MPMSPLPGTRERIIDSARRLFHENGYSAVSVADICDHAEVVKGSFYHFFPSKKELLEETIERNWSQLEGLLQALEKDPRDGRQCLNALFDLILQEARSSHRECGKILGCRLGTIASELAAIDQAPESRSIAAFEGWRRSLRRLIRRGQEDGSIAATLDASAAADALLASIQGMSVLGRALHQPKVLKRVASMAMLQIPPPT